MLLEPANMIASMFLRSWGVKTFLPVNMQPRHVTSVADTGHIIFIVSAFKDVADHCCKLSPMAYSDENNDLRFQNDMKKHKACQ